MKEVRILRVLRKLGKQNEPLSTRQRVANLWQKICFVIPQKRGRTKRTFCHIFARLHRSSLPCPRPRTSLSVVRSFGVQGMKSIPCKKIISPQREHSEKIKVFCKLNIARKSRIKILYCFRENLKIILCGVYFVTRCFY